MSKRASGTFLPTISVDHESRVALYKQIYETIRSGILRGTLRKGLRLPSTRDLASELKVSRNIVVIAFEQLIAEGYLESKTGAGTYVTTTLPEENLYVRPVQARRQISQRGTAVRKLWLSGSSMPTALRYAPFRNGLPALDELPLDLWARLLFRNSKKAPAEVALHGHPAGLLRLREAIATYVGVARGVRCDANQVVVVNGSQQGIDLAARVLSDPGDSAIIEDPGYAGARSALIAAGIKLIPVRVGPEGLPPDVLLEKQIEAKLVYVTPSHQFPLGAVLPLVKRLQLLDWTVRNEAWILEDDFDSEYRYESRPIAALQGLDQNGRVIYIGTFSKVLFPSLRLGYLIVPPDLVDAFISARWTSDRTSPLIDQAALADFITEGHLATHIRRMRALYMNRREIMLEALRREGDDLLEVSDTGAGMDIVAWLPPNVNDRRVSAELANAGIYALPISSFALRPLSRGGLLLGYTAFKREVVRKGVRTLTSVLRKLVSHR